MPYVIKQNASSEGKFIIQNAWDLSSQTLTVKECNQTKGSDSSLFQLLLSHFVSGNGWGVLFPISMWLTYMCWTSPQEGARPAGCCPVFHVWTLLSSLAIDSPGGGHGYAPLRDDASLEFPISLCESEHQKIWEWASWCIQKLHELEFLGA